MAEQPDLFSSSAGSEPLSKEADANDQTDSVVEPETKPVNPHQDANDQSITDNFKQVNNRHKLFNALGRGLLVVVVLLLFAMFFKVGDDDDADLVAEFVERGAQSEEQGLEKETFTASAILPADQSIAPQVKATKVSKRILLYSGPNERGTILSSVKSALNLDVKNPGIVWTEVTPIDGIPVWISRKNAKPYGTGYTIVTRENIKAYSKPEESDTFMYGRLPEGEVSRLILKNKDWFRVIAPRTFTVWVKTSALSEQ